MFRRRPSAARGVDKDGDIPGLSKEVALICDLVVTFLVCM